MVAIHPAQKHGVNAEERYGLQKYRFPITDSGRLARTAVHRHPPRCPSPTWTGHRNNTATACAKGCPLLPDPLAPTVPPLSPFVSVTRFTLDASFFSRESAHSPALSIPPMGSSFFLEPRSVRSHVYNGTTCLRSSVQTNSGRTLSSLFLRIFLSPFLYPFSLAPSISTDSSSSRFSSSLAPASFSRAYSRPSLPALSLYSLCLHSSHDD